MATFKFDRDWLPDSPWLEENPDDTESVRAWLEAGGDANAFHNGETFRLLPAALLGIGDYGVKDTGTIKVLLEFGADPESKWFGLTPLALLCGQAGLASSGLYPPSPWANERESLADERESLDNLLVDVARLILDHGAEIDGMSGHDYGPGHTSNDACGYTPLMLFAICGYPPLVRLLLNRGADVDVKNDRGHTAEMMALQGDEMQSCPNYSGTQRIEPNDPAKVAHYDALWQLMPNELTDYCLNFWQRDDCLRCAGMIADARRARYRYQMILLFELCSRGRATPPLWGTIARLFPSAAYSSRAPDWDRRRARTLARARLPKAVFRLILEFYVPRDATYSVAYAPREATWSF